MEAIPLIYPQGYSVCGMEIIGKHGHPLLPDKHNIVKLFNRNSPKGYIRMPYAKIIYAAKNNIDIRDIPPEYSFMEVDGEILVFTHSGRMAYLANERNKQYKLKLENYDFIHEYAQHMIDFLNGKIEAKANVFRLLNKRREEFIQYAQRQVGKSNAIDIADNAIFDTLELIFSGTYEVPSPIASVKWHINKIIRERRKTRTMEGLYKLTDGQNTQDNI